MTFTSFPFLLFVAAVVLVYYLVPGRFQWCVLLLASLVFYWVNSRWLLLVLLAAAALTYGAGRAIYTVNDAGRRSLKEQGAALSREEKKLCKERTKKKAKRILLLGVLLDLGMLLFLKYHNFFAETSNSLLGRFGLTIPLHRLLLPLGISYYTLQAIAYMVDIYRGKYEPDRNFGKFLLFMSFFPQLIQGPIARHDQLARQLYAEHRFDYQRLCYGVQLMLWGWMKKLIIADRLAMPVDQIFNNSAQYSGLLVFFGAVCYGLQVYTDFSGGIDVARGFSQILGVELAENFRQPYFSRSIEEFWRRWHITLGAWLRDYVFYPLSLSKTFGNLGKKARKTFGTSFGKKLPAFLAMFIVYFLVGFWHGPSWKYIAFGVWNAVFIMSGILLKEFYEAARQKCGIREDAVTWRVFQMFRTFLICSMGRFFSRAGRLTTAVSMFASVFRNTRDLSFLLDGTLLTLGLDTANWFLLFIAVLVLFAVGLLHERGVRLREAIAAQPLIFRWGIYCAAVLALLVFGMYGPAYSKTAFIYEQF